MIWGVSKSTKDCWTADFRNEHLKENLNPGNLPTFLKIVVSLIQTHFFRSKTLNASKMHIFAP